MNKDIYSIEAENAEFSRVARDPDSSINTYDFRVLSTERGLKYVKGQKFVHVSEGDYTGKDRSEEDGPASSLQGEVTEKIR